MSSLRESLSPLSALRCRSHRASTCGQPDHRDRAKRSRTVCRRVAAGMDGGTRSRREDHPKDGPQGLADVHARWPMAVQIQFP